MITIHAGCLAFKDRGKRVTYTSPAGKIIAGDLVDVIPAGRDHLRLVLAGAEGWRPSVRVPLTAPVEVTA